MLKTRIELITGFLGSGKTTWINKYLKLTTVRDEKTVVLQLEKGEEKLHKLLKQQASTTTLADGGELLTLSYLKNLLVLYEPHRLIIECNGMKMIDELIDLLSTPIIRKRAFISTMVNLVEAPKYKVYWQNLKPILKPALSLSHMIVVTKTQLMSLQDKQDLQNLLEIENTQAHIIWVEDTAHMEQAMHGCSLLDKGWSKTLRIQFVNTFNKLFGHKGESI